MPSPPRRTPTRPLPPWSEAEVREVIDVVAASGVAVDVWTVLSRANRLVLALGGSRLVAKAVRIGEAARLARELAVAGHVAAREGPVAPPAPGTAVLLGASTAVSLWQPVESLAPPSDAAALDAYLSLRRCLDSFPDPLPDVRETIDRATRLLDTAPLHGVSGADFALLRAVLASGIARLVPSRRTARVLHGDPHPGNLASTPHGPRWLDLEDVCAGPVKWDLSALPRRSPLVPHDPDLLAALIRLRRACVVVWCSSKARPSAAETDAAAHPVGGPQGRDTRAWPPGRGRWGSVPVSDRPDRPQKKLLFAIDAARASTLHRFLPGGSPWMPSARAGVNRRTRIPPSAHFRVPCPSSL